MNPTALKLMREIKTMCFIDQDNGRGDEVRIWATLDEDVVAKMIADALAQARLEGAKAMQARAAKTNLDNADKEWVKDSLWDNMAKRFAASILSLDPQQVINESTGK
jgi:hypothetical protein